MIYYKTNLKGGEKNMVKENREIPIPYTPLSIVPLEEQNIEHLRPGRPLIPSAAELLKQKPESSDDNGADNVT